MFFCAKKVIYLSLYEQGEKKTGAGFASLQGEGEETCIKVRVKDVGECQSGKYPLCIMTEKEEISPGEIEIKEGCGNYEKAVPVNLEKIDVIQIKLDKEKIIANKWIEGGRKTKQTPQETEPILQKTEPALQTAERRPEEERFAGWLPENRKETENIRAVPVFSDKWEQLKSQYQKVHPFGDEREFITIEPKDFVVLGEGSQKLVNNSFLLHGFYNYRHLILGKDYQLGSGGKVCFYIGVPGVFFEREKMVAVMFGFEGFETAGPVEIGKFGYYLRKVEL